MTAKILQVKVNEALSV